MRFFYPILHLRLKVTILAFICYASFSIAQQRTVGHEGLAFDEVNMELSQNTVTSILQDHKGFLWFGTRSGLNRFDGADMDVFEHADGDPLSLSENYVQCLYEDADDNLWIGTLRGLSYYDRSKNSFKVYKHIKGANGGLSDNHVTAIHEDRKGRLWIGTMNGGLNFFDREHDMFIHYGHNPDDSNSLSTDHVTAIGEDHKGHLLIGTWEGGLDRLDIDAQQFRHHHRKEGLKNGTITKILKGNGNHFWIGTHAGVSIMTVGENDLLDIRPMNDFPKSVDGAQVVLSLLEDSKNRLWIGIENQGLLIYDISTGTYQHYKDNDKGGHYISSKSIWSMYEDRVGTIWLGTFDRGVLKNDPYQRKFSHYQKKVFQQNGLSHSVVSSFSEDNDGNLWIGTDGGGLNFWNRKTDRFTHFRNEPSNDNSLSANAVVSLMMDRYGKLWVGTWEGGLNEYNPRTGEFKRYQHDENDSTSIIGNNVFAICEDSQNRLWVGAYRDGLELLDRETGHFTHFEADHKDSTGLSSNLIRCIFEDKHQNLWIGTEGHGVNLLVVDEDDQVSFKHFKHNSEDPYSISSNQILSFLEDTQGNLWIGTANGLNKYDYRSGRFTAYHKSDGLPNEVIYGVLEDDFNNLWLSTNKGLSKFNTVKKAFKNFDPSDGIQAYEFSKGAYLKSSSGELLFGGINGFNAFYPGAVKENKNIPDIFITGFTLFDQKVMPGEKGTPLKKDITEAKEIVLSYDENVFSFQFSALNFSQAAKNQYAYQLEGYDQQWQYVGRRDEAYYTKVPPGSYTFMVKGANNDGYWNEEGTSIKLRILPPWWKTTYAYIFYFLVLAGILFWYRRIIIHRERLKVDLKLEHLELTKMQEMDQVKSRFFANISHEFRTPLTLILSPLRAMAAGDYEGNPKKQFAVMIRNAERLLHLINQLLDLSKLEMGHMKLKVSEKDLVAKMKILADSFKVHAQKQKIDFRCTYTQKKLPVYFDDEKIEQIVINLLSNAFKYTQEQGTIHFLIEELRGRPALKELENLDDAQGLVRIIVADSGMGIPEEQLAYVFDRFYQVDRGESFGKVGTGIGLAIAKELVELHQGAITVESSHGIGTTFSIYLPLGHSHFLPEQLIANPDVSEKRSEYSITDTDTVLAELNKDTIQNEDSEEITENPKDKKPLVLVVEDNEDLRAYICDYLRSSYQCIQAVDGVHGMDLAVKYIPDVIVSDVMMPKLTGIELCEQIKQEEKTSHIPVILLTAKADHEDKLEGLEFGADHYITKPFDPKVLELRIKNTLLSKQRLSKRILEGEVMQLEPTKLKPNSADANFIKKALSCVEKHISDSEFNVEKFNKAMGLSRMQSYRKLKALTGQSVNEFIRTIRLKRAAQLIEQQELTIAEVTYEVGFNDLKYFRHCFKKQFGVNPSEYKLEKQ